MIVVHGREPILRAGRKVGGALDDERRFSRNEAEAVEAQHAVIGRAETIAHGEGSAEGRDGGGIEDGRGGIRSARFRQREEPLNEVVDRFEVIVVPGEDLGQRSSGIVGRTIAIEGDEGMWLAGLHPRCAVLPELDWFANRCSCDL